MGREELRNGDEGMSIVVVIGSMMTLMILVLGSLAYMMQSEKFSRHDQDYAAAMTAAQSGVEDYVSRLNRNDNYHAEVDCDNVALKGPTTMANSCGWTTTTPRGWSTVTAGDASAGSPAFHYEVDASRVYNEGTVLVRSTGRSRDVYRTIEVAVGKGGSTDYVYYTDYESADPANLIAYPRGAAAQCGGGDSSEAKYFWQTRKDCSEIQFIEEDELDGRVFSNDAILSKNASFKQSIETANPSCNEATASQSTWSKCLRSGSTARFNGIKPEYKSAWTMDDNSVAFSGYPGCHYYGSTRVIFNADGTMQVWSKDSNFSDAVLTVSGPEGSPSCGSKEQLASDAGARVDIPDDMVIYVDATPATGNGSVTKRQLHGDEIGGPAGRKLPLGTLTQAKWDSFSKHTYDLNMAEETRFRGEGNLYVEGTLRGRVTVAAAQSVIVTGDLVLAGGLEGSDMLGLVATNSVEVMHPRMVTRSATTDRCIKWGFFTCAEYSYKWNGPTNAQESHDSDYGEGTWPTRITDPSTGSYIPAKGIQIMGSIQTLQHSFFVQRYNEGPGKGELRVRGSIAQRWRGAVGTSSGSGYEKKYIYDKRLQFSAPPYFPRWTNAEWNERYSGEIATPSEVKS